MSSSADTEPDLVELARRPRAARLLAAHAALPVAVDPALLRHLRDNFLLDGPEEERLPITPGSETVMARLLLSPLFTQVDDDLFEMRRPVRAILLRELQQIDGGRRIDEVAALLERYALNRAAWSDELRWAQRLSARVPHDPQAVQDWLAVGTARGGGLGLGERWFVAMRDRIEQDRATSSGQSLDEAPPGGTAPRRDGVFVTYRRSESEIPQAIIAALQERLGPDRVVRDQAPDSGIFIGRVTRRVVAGCAVLLVVLDEQWTTPEGLGLLADRNDFMREEILHAYRNGTRVVLALVEGRERRSGASIQRENLPSDLWFLTDLSAARVRWDALDTSIADIVDHVADLLPERFSILPPRDHSVAPTREAVDALLRAVLSPSQQQLGNRERLVALVLDLTESTDRIVSVMPARYRGGHAGSATVIVTEDDVIIVDVDDGFSEDFTETFGQIKRERRPRSSVVDVRVLPKNASESVVDLDLVIVGRTRIRLADMLNEQGRALAHLLRRRVTGVPKVLVDFARRLDTARQRRTPRTAVLEELRTRALDRDPTWRAARPKLLDAVSAGERLIGVVLLQIDPDPEFLDRLAAKVTPGADHDHIGYEAAMALRNAAEFLAPEHLDLVSTAVETALGSLTGFRPSDRTSVLERARTIIMQRRETPTPPDRVATTWRLWDTGSALRVRFLNGSRSDQAQARLLLLQWTDGTELRCEFLPPGSTAAAQIRVEFVTDPGTWSHLGTDALLSAEGPTMTIQVANDGIVSPAHTLRTFGRALGLLHEHQQPHADLPWDRKAVIQQLTGSPNHLTREVVELSVLCRYDLPSPPEYRPFDRYSIMLPPFGPSMFTDDVVIPVNTSLSAADRTFITRLYPPRDVERDSAPRRIIRRQLQLWHIDPEQAHVALGVIDAARRDYEDPRKPAMFRPLAGIRQNRLDLLLDGIPEGAQVEYADLLHSVTWRENDARMWRQVRDKIRAEIPQFDYVDAGRPGVVRAFRDLYRALVVNAAYDRK